MKKMVSRISLAAVIALTTLATAMVNNAYAQQPPGKLSDDQLMGYIGKDPLPPGTIPWQLLRQVKLVETKLKDAKTATKEAVKETKGAAVSFAATPNMIPEFGPQIRELDKQEVKLYGFVLPLSTSAKQKHFLLSPLPSHCPFCVNQGPDSMVEVVAKAGVEYNQWEPIVVTGRLELVNDQYLFYRLNNAEQVKY